MLGIKSRDLGQQGRPVGFAPVFRLRLCPDANRQERRAAKLSPNIVGLGRFAQTQPHVPVRGVVQIHDAQGINSPSQALGLGFKIGRTMQLSPHKITVVPRESDNLRDSAKPEEQLIASNSAAVAKRGQIYQDLRTKPPNLSPHREDLPQAPHPHRVLQIAMHQTGIPEHRCRRRRLRMNGDIREQAPLGIWKGALNLVEAGKRHDRIAEAAQPVNQDAFDFRVHALASTGAMQPHLRHQR